MRIGFRFCLDFGPGGFLGGARGGIKFLTLWNVGFQVYEPGICIKFFFSKKQQLDIEGLEQGNRELKDQKEGVETQLKASWKTNQENEQKISDLGTNLQAAKSKVKALEGQKKQLNKGITDLKADKAKLTDEKSKLDTDLAETKSSLKKAQDTVVKNNDKIAGLEVSNTRLRGLGFGVFSAI